MLKHNQSSSLANNNPNTEWAAIFVDELARGGLSAVCIAPGSRSTPLALAFHAHPHINIYAMMDERSAAFFALGIALAHEKAVALLCTSGTASANFHPAIIEAQLSQVPLIILTADRPHELRNSGANQTIDQIKMFGDHVLWSVDVGLPHIDASPVVIRYLRTLAARALATAGGIVKGPVHLNFPFRKPLEPLPGTDLWHPVKSFDNERPHTLIEIGSVQPTKPQISFLSVLINKFHHGLIICGPGCPGDDFPALVAELSNSSGYPILADPLSGVRYGPHFEGTAVIGGYETFLQKDRVTWQVPEIVLHFGRVPTSKWLNEYLAKNLAAYHVHIRENGVWADGDHITNYFLQASPAELCLQLTPLLTRSLDQNWLDQWTEAESIYVEATTRYVKKRFFDGSVVSTVLDQIPTGASLFVGNSLAVRQIDQFGLAQQKSVQIFSNRGASGIDGNISTGLGIAVTTSKPAVLLVGDVTFYHDSNGLHAVKKFGIDNVVIILINNNGGGIFRRLPVSRFEPAFEELFIMPHNLDFEPLAKLYDLDYLRAAEMTAFKEGLATAFSKRRPIIIEVQTDGHADELARREFISLVNT